LSAVFFSILIVISLFIFFNLGKIRASEKQRNRNDRVQWGKRPWSKQDTNNVSEQIDGTKVIDVKPEDVKNKSDQK
jgi:uncharacterized protein YnzC (UPF0291/DUF896 family)